MNDHVVNRILALGENLREICKIQNDAIENAIEALHSLEYLVNDLEKRVSKMEEM